jgi:hypothetical protein
MTVLVVAEQRWVQELDYPLLSSTLTSRGVLVADVRLASFDRDRFALRNGADGFAVLHVNPYPAVRARARTPPTSTRSS